MFLLVDIFIFVDIYVEVLVCFYLSDLSFGVVCERPLWISCLTERKSRPDTDPGRRLCCLDILTGLVTTDII